MVLTALLITGMVAMLGLAIDGGRLYVERRVLQTGVDITSLAAADAYFGSINSGGTGSAPLTAAYTAGLNEFAHQVDESTSGWSASGAVTACDGSSTTYSKDGYAMTLTAISPANTSNVVTGLCVFKSAATYSIAGFFISVVGFGTIPAGAQASALSGFIFTPPTMLILDTDCSVSASDLKIHGTAQLTVDGTSWSDGNIVDQSTSVDANGNVYDACDPWANPLASHFNFADGDLDDVAGVGGVGNAPVIPDPLATWAASDFPGECTTWSCTTTSNTDATSGSVVELRPGNYSATNSFGSGCWFMQPGIYNFSTGVTMNTHGMVLSNELTPPDGTIPAASGESPQFAWTDSGQTCTGGLKAYSGSAGVGNGLLSNTTYYFKATSAREESVNSTNYWRESYLSGSTLSSPVNSSPSGCVSVQVPVADTSTSVEIGISNVPGMGNTPAGSLVADEYRIYANTTGCNSPMGYVTTASFTSRTPAGANQSQTRLSGCPNLPASAPTPNQFNQNAGNCSLGYTATIQMSASNVLCQLATQLLCSVAHPGSTYWPGPLASTYCNISAPTAGCQPKALDPSNPLGASQDTANENYCVSSSGLCSITPKAGSDVVTPGGSMLYFPLGSACIKQSQGAPYVFGALQMSSVVFYAQGQVGSNACSPNGANINGSQGGQFIGEVYMPGPTNAAHLLTVDGGGSPIDGGIIVWTLDVGGNSNTLLTGRFPHEQVITPGHLIVCTNPGGTATCPAP